MTVLMVCSGGDNQYDLIILDVLLPGKDGLDVCRQLRAKKNSPLF